MNKITQLLALILLTLSFSVFSQVNVSINVDNPEHHLATITLEFSALKNAETTDFYLPTWRTGRYEILNLANGIRDFSAKDEQGRALTWRKLISIPGR